MVVSSQHHVPAAILPGKDPGSHGIGDWVGLNAGVNVLSKRKISRPCRDSTPDCAARSTHYPVSKFALVIIRDLEVLLIRHEVRNYSVTYRQRLNDHPNSLENLYFKDQITIVGLSGINL